MLSLRIRPAFSDRSDRRAILIIGFAVLVAADVALAMANSISGVAFGVILWGVHMALTRGLLATLVADSSPVELRGTAFGFFNLASGIATLIASVVAGALWDAIGPSATFFAGAAFTILALLGLPVARRRLPNNLAPVRALHERDTSQSLLALVPVLMLFAGAAIVFLRDKRTTFLLQLLGAGSIALVIATHICEVLQLFPAMQWGDEQSIGHFIDLANAVLGLTLFPIGYLLRALAKSTS